MKEKGITLIALVITIIILLILSGVTIMSLTGDNGMLRKAEEAKEENEYSSAREKLQMEIYASYGADGKVDVNVLKENLKKIGASHININESGGTVNIDDVELEISDDFKNFNYIKRLVASEDKEFRKNNKIQKPDGSNIEIRSYSETDDDFVGAYKFSGIDTQKSIKSASLVLVAMLSNKSTIRISPFTNEWTEANTQYENVEEKITEAKNNSNYVEFTNVTPPVGASAKMFEALSEGTVVADWTNKIDITNLLKDNKETTISFLVSNQGKERKSEGDNFFTKDASESNYGDATIKNSSGETVTRWSQIMKVCNDDIESLKPYLIIKYDD